MRQQNFHQQDLCAYHQGKEGDAFEAQEYDDQQYEQYAEWDPDQYEEL